MAELNPRQEAFCHAYADHPNGAAAARLAGYSPQSAAQAAHELLRRPDVTERIAQLRSSRQSERTVLARRLIDKLEPVYDAGIGANDMEIVLLVVELQARIAGLIHGGSSIRLRPAGRSDGTAPPAVSHEDALNALS